MAYEGMIMCDQNRWGAGVSLDCEVGMYIQDRDMRVSSVADEPAAPKKMVLPVINNAERYRSRQTA